MLVFFFYKKRALNEHTFLPHPTIGKLSYVLANTDVFCPWLSSRLLSTTLAILIPKSEQQSIDFHSMSAGEILVSTIVSYLSQVLLFFNIQGSV